MNYGLLRPNKQPLKNALWFDSLKVLIICSLLDYNEILDLDFMDHFYICIHWDSDIKFALNSVIFMFAKVYVVRHNFVNLTVSTSIHVVLTVGLLP